MSGTRCYLFRLFFFLSSIEYMKKKKSIFGYLIVLFYMTHRMNESEIFISIDHA